jgi:putative ABC transport system permease protein
MGRLVISVRYALRMLRKHIGFTLVAVASIALGVGVNTAIFSLVNALLLRPLPVPDPERVVNVYPGAETTSYIDYRRYRDSNDVFEGLVGHAIVSLNLKTDLEPERVFGQVVTGNYFSVLGVNPVLGRGFLPEEDAAPGKHPVAVLSYAFWRGRFQADPTVIGRTITLNRRPFTVVGVAPRGFVGTFGGYAPQIWVPVMMQADVWPGQDRLTSREASGMSLTGRLKPGVSYDQARVVIETLTRRLDEGQAERRSSWGFTMVERAGGVFFRLRQPVRGVLTILFMVVWLLLMIACANVAGLLLARATTRRKELALRLALGATRLHLFTQLLVENVVLWLLGGLAGLGVSAAATSLLMAYRPDLPIPFEPNLAIDYRVAAFAMVVSLVSGLLFGVAPALQASRSDVVHGLKDEVGRLGARRVTLRQVFVVGQSALAFIIIIGAGLFVKSLRNASAIDPGFDTDHGIVASFALGTSGYSEAAQKRFYDDVVARTSAIPGVRAVSLSLVVPLSLHVHEQPVTIEGQETPTRALPYNLVGPGYFETMGIPIVRGRDFTTADREGARDVAVINESMARRFWPNQDPVGRSIRHASGPESFEIIGVARDIKYRTLGELPAPFLYLPFSQRHNANMHLHVRTAGDPRQVLPAVRQVAQQMDVSLAVDTKLLIEHLGITFLLPRVGASVLAMFGLLGLGLASLGIFGVVSAYVNGRIREIGVRVAIGASRGQVVRLVLGRGMALTAVGIGFGILGGLGFTRLLAGYLYDVNLSDPIVFALTAGLLLAVAALACLLPIRRALAIDPAAALRYD